MPASERLEGSLCLPLLSGDAAGAAPLRSQSLSFSSWRLFHRLCAAAGDLCASMRHGRPQQAVSMGRLLLPLTNAADIIKGKLLLLLMMPAAGAHC